MGRLAHGPSDTEFEKKTNTRAQYRPYKPAVGTHTLLVYVWGPKMHVEIVLASVHPTIRVHILLPIKPYIPPVYPTMATKMLTNKTIPVLAACPHGLLTSTTLTPHPHLLHTLNKTTIG